MLPRECLAKDLNCSSQGRKLLLALKADEKRPHLTRNGNANGASIRLARSQGLATPCDIPAWGPLTPLNTATS